METIKEKAKTILQIIGVLLLFGLGISHYLLPENSQYQWPLVIIFAVLVFAYLSWEKK